MSMSHDGDATETAAELARDRLPDDIAVVVPSADLWATVRFAAPPEHPPDELLAFTTREHDDWVLTDDVLALGESTLTELFLSWRSTWERTWILEPFSSLRRLIDLAGQFGDHDLDVLGSVFASEDDEIVLARELHQPVAAALVRLAEFVRARDAHGWALVDRSPGSERVGLARSWPGWGGDEVLASTGSVDVLYRPATGLHLISRAEGAAATSFGPITAATSDSSGWTITAGDQRQHLSQLAARPLAWLVPDATAWSVRRVPEVITWAKTFGRLPECLRFATQCHAPVLVTTLRPIATSSDPPDAT